MKKHNVLNVMLVEDNEDHIHFILNALDKQKYKLRIISDGKEAYKYLMNAKSIPDVVLLDYFLPSMNGLEIMNKVREKDRDIAFIFLTVDTRIDTVVEAMKAGAMDFLPKTGKFYNGLQEMIEKVYNIHRERLNNKAIEEALHKSEERYRSFIENSNDLIWECNETGRFTYLNPAWEKVIGYKLNEMRGHKFTDFLLPELVGENTDTFSSIIQGKPVSGYDTIYISKSGEKVYLHFNVVKLLDSDKNIIGTQGIAFDTTVQQKAEEALRKSEAQYRAVTESAIEAIISFNSKGKIIFWNNAAKKMFGYQKKYILNKPFPILIFGKNKEKYRKAFDSIDPAKELFVEGKTQEMEGKRKDGSGFPLEISVSKWNTCEEVFFTAIIRDISERKEAEKQLAALNKLNLFRKNREQKIRTLSLIKGMEKERSRISRELHDGLGQELTTAKMVAGRLMKHIEKRDKNLSMSNDLKNIIDSALIETKRISHDLMPSILDDFGLVPALKKLTNQLNIGSGIIAKFESKGSIERLPSNVEIGMYRIAQEAVSNALEHSGAKNIWISLTNRNKCLRLIVQDDGMGFDIHKYLKISGNTLHNGLINMQERASLMDGEFRLDSGKGSGTSIIIEIKIKVGKRKHNKNRTEKQCSPLG